MPSAVRLRADYSADQVKPLLMNPFFLDRLLARNISSSGEVIRLLVQEWIICLAGPRIVLNKGRESSPLAGAIGIRIYSGAPFKVTSAKHIQRKKRNEAGCECASNWGYDANSMIGSGVGSEGPIRRACVRAPARRTFTRHRRTVGLS